MKKSVIAMAVGAMGLLMLAAVVWDSLRYISEPRSRVQLADAEIQKQEERLVKLLAGSSKISPEVRAAIDDHAAAGSASARRERYDALVRSFRQTMSGEIDPANPLDRRFSDDIAGAINRREVAEKQYDVEWAAYRETLGGFRGRVARLVSPSVRADWNSNGS